MVYNVYVERDTRPERTVHRVYECVNGIESKVPCVIRFETDGIHVIVEPDVKLDTYHNGVFDTQSRCLEERVFLRDYSQD